MANPAVMLAPDTISGAMATAFVTIEGKRYNLMQLYSFEAKMEIKTTEVAILGRTGKGTKSNGWSGKWTGKAHYNQSVLRQMWLGYKKTGEMPLMDIQITNYDMTSSAGRQTIILKNCLTNGGVITKFDADTQVLTEELTGTFDDWDMPEQFTLINGMV